MSGDLLPQDLKRRVLATVNPTPTAVRSFGQRVGISAGLLLIAFLVGMMTKDGLPGFRWVSTAIGLLALTAAVALVRTGMDPRSLPPLARLGSGVVLVWAAVALVGASHLDARSLVHAATWGCWVHAAVGGILASVGLLGLWRFSNPARPRAVGFLVGAVAGVVAGAGVGIACPSTEAVHLAIGHGSMGLVMGFVGMFVADRSWRG